MVCREVALTVNTCNAAIKRYGLTPLGLSVEGHTSADLGSAVQNSLLRATSTRDAIHEALVELPGRVQPAQFKAVGYGAQRPLAGFEDGNYERNRRVEIYLIEEAEMKEVLAQQRWSVCPLWCCK